MWDKPALPSCLGHALGVALGVVAADGRHWAHPSPGQPRAVAAGADSPLTLFFNWIGWTAWQGRGLSPGWERLWVMRWWRVAPHEQASRKYTKLKAWRNGALGPAGHFDDRAAVPPVSETNPSPVAVGPPQKRPDCLARQSINISRIHECVGPCGLKLCVAPSRHLPMNSSCSFSSNPEALSKITSHYPPVCGGMLS